MGLRHGNVCENRVDARFPRWRRVDRLSSQRVFQPVDARLEQPVKPGFGEAVAPSRREMRKTTDPSTPGTVVTTML